MNVHSIAFKINLTLVLVLTLILAGFGYFDYRQTSQRLLAERELRIEQTVNRLQQQLVTPLWNFDAHLVKQIIRAETDASFIHTILVSDNEGKVIAGVTLVKDKYQAIDRVPASRTELVYQSRAIEYEGQTIGHIELIQHDNFIKTRLKDKIIELFIEITVLDIILSLLLTLSLHKIVLKPLSRLAGMFDAIHKTHGSLNQRLECDSSDEIGQLCRGTNDMLDTIENQNRALHEARDELESQVITRTHELEVANRELEAFSYSVSHDLRAPLRSIDGFSHALLEDYRDRLDETGRNYLDRVRVNCQRMGELIDDLLNLSLMSRRDFHRQKVDLSKLVVTIMQNLQEQAPQRRASVKIKSNVVVNGDRRLLLIMLENLLGNAWKYSANKQQSFIEFGEKELEGERVFFVSDNGSGFDLRYADKLFGVFQRLHGNEYEGTGIGLATVQRIIVRHGGRIWAESAPDKGAIFYFTIPDSID